MAVSGRQYMSTIIHDGIVLSCFLLLLLFRSLDLKTGKLDLSTWANIEGQNLAMLCMVMARNILRHSLRLHTFVIKYRH